ncbi:hypothetical protein FZ046_10535 [Mycolicibacterium grossiae]|nr:hypothetical protein FZ046_10535 [Mycolicibacterium grossiae]
MAWSSWWRCPRRSWRQPTVASTGPYWRRGRSRSGRCRGTRRGRRRAGRRRPGRRRPVRSPRAGRATTGMTDA